MQLFGYILTRKRTLRLVQVGNHAALLYTNIDLSSAVLGINYETLFLGK